MTKVRIIDVAEKAGVSKSTVSQFLNGRFGHMSEETKQRISQTIDALNYVPNPIARSLKSQKSKTIGVVVRDISGLNSSKVLRGIDDMCKSAGYNVLIYNTDFDEKVERNSLVTLKQLQVDGIIVTSSGKNGDLINRYVNEGFPLVQFQLDYSDSTSPIVLSDYEEAARNATQYLIDLGHRNIAFLTQDYSLENSRASRFLGYKQALKDNGIAFDSKLVIVWDRTTGYQKLPSSLLKLKHAPTAYFSQHLPLTQALLTDFSKQNIEIPSQVSLLSFDEIPMVEHLKVPITVVKQQSHQIGRESAASLIRLIQGKPTQSRIVVPCELIERQSCAEPIG